MFLFLITFHSEGFYDGFYGYSPFDEAEAAEDLLLNGNGRDAYSEPLALPVIYATPQREGTFYGINRGGAGGGGGGYRKKRSDKRSKTFR